MRWPRGATPRSPSKGCGADVAISTRRIPLPNSASTGGRLAPCFPWRDSPAGGPARDQIHRYAPSLANPDDNAHEPVGPSITGMVEPIFDAPAPIHAPLPVAPPAAAAAPPPATVIPIEWLNSWSVEEWLNSIQLGQCTIVATHSRYAHCPQTWSSLSRMATIASSLSRASRMRTSTS